MPAAGQPHFPDEIIYAIRATTLPDGAACASGFDPELWTSDDRRRREEAAAICWQVCPEAVRRACLQAALDDREQWTVRGGYDFREAGVLLRLKDA
jgi:hypothetical protein